MWTGLGSGPWSTTQVTAGALDSQSISRLQSPGGSFLADRVVVRCAPAVARIAGVDLLGSLDEMADGTGTSVDAAMGAGIGSSIDHPH